MNQTYTGKRGTRPFRLATGLALAWLGAADGQTDVRTHQKITLWAVNFAGVPDRILLNAERETTLILRQAGIQVMWLNCVAGQAVWGNQNPCQKTPGPTEFWLHILMKRPRNLDADALGFSELPNPPEVGNGYAGVLYPAAEDLAKQSQASVSQVLGAAVAHEIGHLLLGTTAHSRGGVMCAHWRGEQLTLASIGELFFTPQQAAHLREEIASRIVGKAISSAGALAPRQ
jgi:hypothetical protein